MLHAHTLDLIEICIAHTHHALAHTQDEVQNFISAWEELDPYGMGYISVWQLSTLISMVSYLCCLHLLSWNHGMSLLAWQPGALHLLDLVKA